MFTDRFNIVNMTILPRLVYRLSATPIKIPAGICIETDKLNLKFIQRTQNSHGNFERGKTFRKKNRKSL